MTGPIARNPLPGEPEWRDRWRDALFAVCGHSRVTHESLPADHRFVPRPNGDPGRPGDSGAVSVHLVNASAPAMRKLLARVARGEWTVDDAVDILHDWPNRAGSPQPTVPRAPSRPCPSCMTSVDECQWHKDACCPACDEAPGGLHRLWDEAFAAYRAVPRAPVEALLNVLAGYHPHDMPADRRRLDALVAELRRHLNGDTT